MIARLAKTSNDDRRHAVPATPVPTQLQDADDVRARTVLLAPTAALHSTGRRCSAKPTLNELDRLYDALETVTPENHPRTARLLGSSNRKVAQKVIEEAGEVALAAVKHNTRNVVRESADLLYHLAVLWRRTGIAPAEIWSEMHRRADSFGIAEKLPKAGA